MSSSKNNNSCSFPWRLHNVLENADTEGFTAIISWLPNGKGFKIYNTMAFEVYIIQNYFNTVKYRSFQRQLQIYGFKRVREGDHRGAYTHPAFIRHQLELCKTMTRTKIKGKYSKKAKRLTVAANKPAKTCNDNYLAKTNDPFPMNTKEVEHCSDLTRTSLQVSKEIARTINPAIADEIINMFGSRQVSPIDLPEATFTYQL